MGVLEAYVEPDSSKEELVTRGFDEEIVARVVAMVDRAEYKRRQAPPGVERARRRSAATVACQSRISGLAEQGA